MNPWHKTDPPPPLSHQNVNSASCSFIFRRMNCNLCKVHYHHLRSSDTIVHCHLAKLIKIAMVTPITMGTQANSYAFHFHLMLSRPCAVYHDPIHRSILSTSLKINKTSHSNVLIWKCLNFVYFAVNRMIFKKEKKKLIRLIFQHWIEEWPVLLLLSGFWTSSGVGFIQSVKTEIRK